MLGVNRNRVVFTKIRLVENRVVFTLHRLGVNRNSVFFNKTRLVENRVVFNPLGWGSTEIGRTNERTDRRTATPLTLMGDHEPPPTHAPNPYVRS